MEELEIGGENIFVLHHIPGRDGDLRQQTKKCTKAPVFGQAQEQLPKLLACPTHHLLSIDVGIINSNLFLSARKLKTEVRAAQHSNKDNDNNDDGRDVQGTPPSPTDVLGAAGALVTSLLPTSLSSQTTEQRTRGLLSSLRRTTTTTAKTTWS